MPHFLLSSECEQFREMNVEEVTEAQIKSMTAEEITECKPELGDASSNLNSAMKKHILKALGLESKDADKVSKL